MLIKKGNSPDWIKNESSTLSQEQAQKQDIRPLRIGIINYMPDAVLEDTEKDFLRPMIEASGSHQFEVQLFNPQSVERGEKASQYIVNHYTELTRKSLAQCDILIHTGANDLDENGEGIDFTESEIAKEMMKNHALAKEAGVTVQVASCLSSQVIAHNEYGISLSSNINRKKVTGVFRHYVSPYGKINFLTKGLNTEFNVVFSRNHSLSSKAIEESERLKSLIVSSEDIFDQQETHLFIDPKELFFGFQGHPEYQEKALYKEFLRDVAIYYRNPEKSTFPNIPPNYFTKEGEEKVQEFCEKVKEVAQKRYEKQRASEISEEELKKFDTENRPQLDDTVRDMISQSWRDTADKIWARIFNATYQLTGFEAGEKFTKKRGIDQMEFPLNALI